MSYSECIDFEKKLAFHTAPTLYGIKSANLFTVDNTYFDVKAHIERFNSKASSKGLSMKELNRCDKRSLILLFNEKILKKRLDNKQCRDLLNQFGYANSLSLYECIEKLSERTKKFDDFPHEIGIFLNYPIEDVRGFIDKKGADFKLCGYWKVYGDEREALHTFDTYNKCRNFLCNKLNQGLDIYQALKLS